MDWAEQYTHPIVKDNIALKTALFPLHCLPIQLNWATKFTIQCLTCLAGIDSPPSCFKKSPTHNCRSIMIKPTNMGVATIRNPPAKPEPWNLEKAMFSAANIDWVESVINGTHQIALYADSPVATTIVRTEDQLVVMKSLDCNPPALSSSLRINPNLSSSLLCSLRSLCKNQDKVFGHSVSNIESQ